MAITAAKCLKIETAGLVIGWTYFVAFVLGFLVILVASVIGMKIYIAGEEKIFVEYLSQNLMDFCCDRWRWRA
jgi:hypothetical protein